MQTEARSKEALLTPEELADYLRCGRTFAYQILARGEIPSLATVAMLATLDVLVMFKTLALIVPFIYLKVAKIFKAAKVVMWTGKVITFPTAYGTALTTLTS